MLIASTAILTVGVIVPQRSLSQAAEQNYGPLVGEIQDPTLYLTEYSPRTLLTK